MHQSFHFRSHFLLHSGLWEPVEPLPAVSSEFLIDLAWTFLDCGWKPENLERTHTDIGRTWKLQTHSSESNPQLSCCEATAQT